MTTVEQIRAEIDTFKANAVQVLDGFAAQGYTNTDAVNELLAEVGIDRPEAPEVREAREELAALKASLRAAVVARTPNALHRSEALGALGL